MNLPRRSACLGKSGAKDARTRNAGAWSVNSAANAKRLGCVRFYRRFFPSGAGRPAVHGPKARGESERVVHGPTQGLPRLTGTGSSS